MTAAGVAIAPREQHPELRSVVTTVTVIAVALFWLIATSWRPWELFERGGFSADFYDEQARVFLRGRLAVDPAVPGPEGFLIGGKTYLYYGPFLAIVRMPLMLFGDLFVGRLVRLSMLIALVVLIRWSARLAVAAHAAVRGADGGPPARGPVGFFVAAVACSPVLFAAGWTSVYHETELWALTLAVVTMTLTLEWAASGFADRRLLLWAGAAALATTLTRAPIGFGVAMAIGLLGLGLLWRHRAEGVRSARDRGGLAVALGFVPLVVHALVNWAKFGSALSVPGDRQLLSINDPARAAWFAGNDNSFFSLRFLSTTLVQYWRPDSIRFERLIPGVRYGPLAENRGSYPVETVTPASSLPVAATLLLVLAVIGVAYLVRQRARTWTLVVAATACGAIPTFMIGFIANRYLIDMLPPLVVAGAVGVWAVPAPEVRRAWRVTGLVLVVWGTWVNAALATWTLELKSPGFTELRHDLDDAIFGGGHDSVTTLDPAAAVPRDGVVGLLADCTGVYIAEQGRWVALDRAPGIRAIDGELAPDESAVIAAGSTWSVTFDAGSSLVEVADGEEEFTVSIRRDGPVRFEVIVDEIMGLHLAEVGDAAFFLSPDLARDGPDIRPGTTTSTPASSLCESLRE